MRERKPTRSVKAGGLIIGGNSPVSVQSMTTTPLSDTKKTIEQINALAFRGASLVRLAILTIDDTKYLREIITQVSIPLCADIHFDYRIALKAIEAGISKIRINPGNIGDESRTRDVVCAAKDAGVPIRIGVNGGSLDKNKYPRPTPQALADSAMEHVRILEDLDFFNTVISIKSSNLNMTIEANRIMSTLRDYPLHVGLTEAGYGLACVVQSSIAIGTLLNEGIGDTIRVSMTGDPLNEIDAGYEILKAVGEIDYGIKIISCPTCGRTDTQIDLEHIARTLDEALKEKFFAVLKEKRRLITVAVMGCEVNGPGEASHADAGIAGARSGSFLLFAKGEKIKRIVQNEVVKEMIAVVEKLIE